MIDFLWHVVDALNLNQINTSYLMASFFKLRNKLHLDNIFQMQNEFLSRAHLLKQLGEVYEPSPAFQNECITFYLQYCEWKKNLQKMHVETKKNFPNKNGNVSIFCKIIVFT